MIHLVLYLSSFQLPAEGKCTSALRALTTVQVSFRQETYSDFMDETYAEGVLKIARPGKLKMSYFKGERKEIICDGDTYYERDKLAGTQSRVPLSDLEKEPLVRLLLFGDSPEQHFVIERISNAKGGDHYRLKPRDDDSYLLDIVFDSDWRLAMLNIIGTDGEGTRFFFSHWNTSPSFDSETFRVPAVAP